ncbi:hypothetical protein B0O99DRAFT_245255 [Bisporella sp. PMI_857]|nr:hypothetical protein B0O99DRAFT_245255 [Bisporella sp. PMI_857]
MERVPATSGKIRKRKAENQDNERLSKRLSLLNLERNGQVLYVPVEEPSVSATTTSKPITPTQGQSNDELMQVDDTKHRVFIYNLDDELSDSETSDDGKIVFLPDIEKHLRESRIPPSILANSEGELAGHNQQLVLYNVPSSLTVPAEQDSVRKAIIETRARARARQQEKREAEAQTPQTVNTNSNRGGGIGIEDWHNGRMAEISLPSTTISIANGTVFPIGAANSMDDDPDAMDLG